MKPNPTRQRKHAHRQRLAFGRALHQVRHGRYLYNRKREGFNSLLRLPVPKILRKHAITLRMEWAL